MSDIRAITIKQPWSFAIAHGDKRVENRAWGTTWTGPLLIHAGQTVEWDALCTVADRTGRWVDEIEQGMVRGVIVAAARMTGEHVCTGTCSPWAVPGLHHFQLTDVRTLDRPIPAAGKLGLWRAPADLIGHVRDQIPGWAA